MIFLTQYSLVRRNINVFHHQAHVAQNRVGQHGRHCLHMSRVITAPETLDFVTRIISAFHLPSGKKLGTCAREPALKLCRRLHAGKGPEVNKHWYEPQQQLETVLHVPSSDTTPHITEVRGLQHRTSKEIISLPRHWIQGSYR